MKEIIISGNKKEVVEIIERIARDNPGVTIKEYCEKYKRERLVLI